MSLIALLLACQTSDAPSREGVETMDTARSESDTGGPEGPGVPTGPEIVGAELESPDPSVHLARRLRVDTDVPTTLVVRIDDGVAAHRVGFPGASTGHEVPVLGLPADHEISVSVLVTDAEGHTTELALPPFRTERMPERFPQMEAFAHDPDAMEPGYRMINLRTADDALDWLVVLDRGLRLVWLRESTPNFGDVRMTERGTLVGLQDVILEIDMLGEEVGRWDPGRWVHHELFPRPGGGWLTLGYGGPVEVGDYPLDDADPLGDRGPAWIRPDVLLELGPTGTVESELSLVDVLDVGRIGFGSLDVVDAGPVYDWSHANGVIALDDGSRIVSVCHQGAVLKLDDQNELQWILADPAGWSAAFAPLLLEPVGEVSWPYCQHAPEWTDDGLLVLFDNHNDGHTPYTSGPAEQPASRGVAYRIDEAAGTVEVAWEIPAPGYLFSAALGDADVLPETGNVLLDFGFLDAEDGLSNVRAGRGRRSIRLVEAHPDHPDQPVLDLSLWGNFADEPGGYRAYRAEHLPSLYAAEVTVAFE